MSTIRFDCPVCGDRFTSETGVRDHTWAVHDACHHCGERFDDRAALYTHWLERHENDLSREDRKRAETKVGDRTVCPVCEERFKNANAVRRHAWDVHHACHVCGDRFDDRESLYPHWLGAHDDDLTRDERERAEAAVGRLSFRDRITHGGALDAVSSVSIGRRTLLGGGVAVSAAVLGGAFAGGYFGRGADSDTLESHPAGETIKSQPWLGPAPSDAPATIVAFEDPSCPSCARFERGTFPQLKSELIDTGILSFVYRGIPVVQPWGDPAVLALEATFARSAAAFWALKDFYYQSQPEIGSQNVRSETRDFLAGRTEIDANAVLTDVDRGTYRGAVETDLETARDAGVRGTPTFFLFRDGSYVTDIVGAQSFSVFKNTLGV